MDGAFISLIFCREKGNKGNFGEQGTQENKLLTFWNRETGLISGKQGP